MKMRVGQLAEPASRPEERRYTAVDLMKLLLAERERILEAQAAEAAEEYRTNPAQSEFWAFGFEPSTPTLAPQVRSVEVEDGTTTRAHCPC
jgi:hypothetical protein